MAKELLCAGTSCVTLFILEFVRSVVTNDLTERTDSLISAVNNGRRLRNGGAVGCRESGDLEIVM